MILAGDVGGTKVNLALYDFVDGTLRNTRESLYPAREYSGLEAIVREFLGADVPTAACFGVPGPVRDGRLRLTNLPWTLDSRELSKSLKIEHVFLINDLQANGYGIAELKADQVYTLSEGDARQIGNRALISAGTGLGESFMIWDGRHYVPYPSEGGHSDFAPRNELEIELLRYLVARFGHVSYERVLSGPGLFNIYRFLKESRGMEEPSWLAEHFSAGDDASATISTAALAGKAEICVKALDLFVSIYGAEAGNMALRFKSVRGLYVGGGIAPKILDKLKDGTFMRSFIDKGRYTELLAAMPVQVVLNPQAGLRGAGYYAAFLSGE